MSGFHSLISTSLNVAISIVFGSKALQTAPLAGRKNITAYAKVFEARESLLTNLLADDKHLKAVYNLILMFFIVFVASTIGNYLINPQDFYYDIASLQWFFGDFHLMAVGWLILHFPIFCLLFPAAKLRLLLIHKTPSFRPIINFIFMLFYVLFVITEFFVSLKCISFFGLLPVAIFALLMEKVRLVMKCHSFVVETFDPIVTTDKDKEQLQLPKLQNFIYFLFAPTLIYRNSYPRTDRIRWRFVVNNFLGFLLTVVGYFWIIRPFLNQNLAETGVEPFHFKMFFVKFMTGFLMGATLQFFIFWNLLHCWHNAFAELLRFADRHFYSDWWNSTTEAEFLRKWNIIVQDWLYAYIYSPTVRITKNKAISTYLVIFISAVVHEYIFTVTLGFVLPIMFVSYTIFGYLIYLLPKIGLKISFDISNPLLLASIFFGYELHLVFYIMEWYARINCPSRSNSYLDYVTPRIFDCVSILY